MLHYRPYPSFLQIPSTIQITNQKIALCIIATHTYKNLINPLIQSINKHLFKKQQLTIYIYTDATTNQFETLNIPTTIIPTPHTPFPLPTLLRHSTLLTNPNLDQHDYIFHIDADVLFVGDIDHQMLGTGLTAIEHPSAAFSNIPQHFHHSTYETNPQSTAYIHPQQRHTYYCGAIQGGTTSSYIQAIETITNNVKQDLGQNIIARYHDESHWNKYLSQNPPSIKLPFWYCFPETSNPNNRVCDWNHQHVVPDGQQIKMLCLDKNLHGGYKTYRGNART